MKTNIIITVYFKPIFVLLLSLGLGHACVAQSETEPSYKKGLDDEQFRKILNQQFTSIITGQSPSSIGNFGSLDLKDAAVTFAGTVPIKTGSLLTVKASGQVTDGLLALIDNFKVNTNIAAELQYNILTKRKKKLGYWTLTKTDYDIAKAKIDMEHDLRIKQIDADLDETKLELRKAELQAQVKDLTDKRKVEFDALKQKVLDYQILEAQTIIADSLDYLLENMPGKEELKLPVKIKRAKQLQDIDTVIGVASFKIDWLSIGIKVKNNKFSYFDSTLAFDKQVVDTNFTTPELTLQYSVYRWTAESYRSYFWAIGTAYSVTDNFASLTKMELSETRNFGAIPGQRASTKKYDAYKGEYNRKVSKLRLYGDAYYFLTKNNSAAIHLYPELIIQEKEKLNTNLGFGFLLSFKDEKSAVFNAELYYNMLDLFNVDASDNDLLKRSSIGLRFAVPIKFKQ